ncbi:MAG: alpha-glucuronidase [Ruminococcus sp.]|nr:alpha-glucuronidase [Ruminococcus sp.]
MNTAYSKLWLDYKPLNIAFAGSLAVRCTRRVRRGCTAVSELITALSALLPQAELTFGADSAVFIIELDLADYLSPEEYTISADERGAAVYGGSENGLLYGVFAYIREIIANGGFTRLSRRVRPAVPLRMLDHWDNADGSIERGYSGSSFFFKDGELLVGDRTVQYARLLASVGINAAAINNVNVRGKAVRLITGEYIPKLAALAEVFSKYGIKLFLSVDFSAPMSVGGLPSADPLDPAVGGWWRAKAAELFGAISGLGGFLVKADSEGQPGPYAYGRDHADGANMLARALKPYGGTVIWRAFVYNCSQDWRDTHTDRARAGYDTFAPLDGRFDDNVILQIKNGPMDFQVREPVHPLFGVMKHTGIAAEFQLAQEYTGQQLHVCCLIPMIKEILAFRTYNGSPDDTVLGAVRAIAAVSNTGDSFCWTGSELAAANLYGFGRLCFEPSLNAEDILEEWISLTFGDDEEVKEKLLYILLGSHKAYEDYTVPLGMGWMCKPNHHYGPDPWGYEFDRWGTYNRADREAVGIDRSGRGTGYSELYYPPLCDIYSSPASCPDELLLFFCRVPYSFTLKSGKTVIQHIYDSHFEGYEQACEFASLWESLKDKLPAEVFDNVKKRFAEQLRCAKEWRDIVNAFFHRLSGIEDEQHRKLY